MAQRMATPQGTKRRYPEISSPPRLHAEESASRRPPYPPISMGGLQAPQVGVAVVTIDMFRDYQKQVTTHFEQQSGEIAVLQEHVRSIEEHIQSINERIQSLEDAEDMAIDAVREIRDSVMPRVEQHHESLESLTAAVNRQNAILDSGVGADQEYRAAQSRDIARPNQLTWRPGPLGGATDQTKNGVEELKMQLTGSIAHLTEHDKRLEQSDARLTSYGAHLAGYEKRMGDHESRLANLQRQLNEHITRLGGYDRHFAERDRRLNAQESHLRNHDLCVAKHADRLSTLDKSNDQLHGRVAVLEQREQRTDQGLSPAQVMVIMQNHQQRLESLEQSLQQHIKVSQEAQAATLGSPRSQSRPACGETHTLDRRSASESRSQAEQTEKASSDTRSSEPLEESTDYTAELKTLGEYIAAMEGRIGPLERRLDSIETVEKLSHATEEEGQYEILSRTSFQKQEDLAGLRSKEDLQLLMQLFSENDRCEDACYTVQRACVHMWSYLLCRSRKDEKLISDFWKRGEWLRYPTVLELEWNVSMPKNKYFPRFVYEIGEIFNRRTVTKYSGRQATHRSTGYHLVVDVTKPAKSLWLIYRYEEISKDQQSLKQSITYKQDSFWHPFANVCEFDIAMVFEKFDDWKGAHTPIGSYATSKKLVRQTAALIKPTFIEPVLQEVKDAIRQGWEEEVSGAGAGAAGP